MGTSGDKKPCVLRAYAEDKGDCPLVVVDLGFSSRNSSNGVVTAYHLDGFQCQFGALIDRVVEALLAVLSHSQTPLLVIEAPLSKLFRKGNPTFRFKTEGGRGWWYGPGATVALGAIELVDRLLSDTRLHGKTVLLAEAFCSHKAEATGDVEDAKLIFCNFAKTASENLNEGEWKPISACIEGIPPIRVFKHPVPINRLA
jgi:hypothetical protein